ncbi:MAG: biotin/lipoyl-binding protein [Anaerolineae bacterium]|nr:biotin/lipoyl-binding protein [Anaerolineae bacterium]
MVSRLARSTLLAGLVFGLAACGPAVPGPGQGLPGAATPVGTLSPLPTQAVAPRTTIIAEGALALATPPLQLSFDVNARVVAVNVVRGQKVKAGEVLAEVDDSQLRNALQQAQEQLALAEAQVRQSQAPAGQPDLDSARAALKSATARYQELKRGPSPFEIEQALRNWNQARNQLYSAQIGRDVECGWSASQPEADKVTPNDPDCKYSQHNVASAEQNERVAYLRYQDAQKPPSQARLAQAYADVAAARANLARLEAGVTEQQKRVSELQLEQSRIAVVRAKRNLDKARLVSPCDCTVQEVNIVPGAIAAPTTPAVTLLRLDNIRLRTTNLTERDIADVRIGAPALVRLRAVQTPLTGRVHAILPLSSGVLGADALFTVIIALDPTGELLLPGMTGQVEIAVN